MLGEARPGSLGAVGVTRGISGLGDGDICFQDRGQGVPYMSFWHSGRLKPEDDFLLTPKNPSIVVGTRHSSRTEAGGAGVQG